MVVWVVYSDKWSFTTHLKLPPLLPLSPVMVEPLAPWLVWYPLELVAPLPGVPLSALKMPVPAFMRPLTPPSTFAPAASAAKNDLY